MTIETIRRGVEDFKTSYRPQRLEELLPTVSIERLRSICSGKSPARVFLFEGPSGVGKTSAARIVARALVCADRKPCLNCYACLNLESSPDFYEINVANFRKIDDIRELIVSFSTYPSQLPKKIYILDEVHQCTRESQQLLLKALEEPPDHIYLFLCTTNTTGLDRILIDRTHLVRFNLPNKSHLKDFLQTVSLKEALEIANSEIDQLIEASNGSVRASLNLLQRWAEGDKDLFSLDTEDDLKSVPALASALLQKGWANARELLLSEEIRKNPETIRIGLESYLRAVLLKNPGKLNIPVAKILSNLVGSLSAESRVSQYNNLVLRCARICTTPLESSS